MSWGYCLSDHGQLCFAAFAQEASSASLRGHCPCLLLHTQEPRYRKREKLTPAHWGLGGGRANSQESTCFVTDTGTHWTHSTSYNFFSGCLAILIRTSPATVFQ